MGGDWIVISLGFPFLSPLTYSPRPKSLGAEKRNEMKIISIKIVFESEEHTEESEEPGNSVPRSRLITGWSYLFSNLTCFTCSYRLYPG